MHGGIPPPPPIGRGAPIIGDIPGDGAPIVEDIPGDGALIIGDIPGDGALRSPGHGAAAPAFGASPGHGAVCATAWPAGIIALAMTRRRRQAVPMM